MSQRRDLNIDDAVSYTPLLKRAARLLLGLTLLPVCIAVSLSLYGQLSQIRSLSYEAQKFFLMGAVAYLAFHALFFKPAYIYVVGHELMHVVAAWISGGRVTSFRVSGQGGSVGTTKSNIFIALAPYFMPFYTVIIALLFFTLSIFTNTKPLLSPFLFLVGFTLAFHIVLTVDFLKIRQTDLLHAGYFFSICLIYIINVIVIALIFSLLFRDVSFTGFITAVGIRTKDIYMGIFRQLFL